MFKFVMIKLYQPYARQKRDIQERAYLLNESKNYEYKIFTMASQVTKPWPCTEVVEYLIPHVERLEPVFKEQARIQCWLLHISNRLNAPSLAFSLLPEILNRKLQPVPITEHDELILRAAEQQEEYTLIRRRLLLGSML